MKYEPFALSLSKGREDFDKLSTNGNLRLHQAGSIASFPKHVFSPSLACNDIGPIHCFKVLKTKHALWMRICPASSINAPCNFLNARAKIERINIFHCKYWDAFVSRLVWAQCTNLFRT
jgi:hypothetical protein